MTASYNEFRISLSPYSPIRANERIGEGVALFKLLCYYYNRAILLFFDKGTDMGKTETKSMGSNAGLAGGLVTTAAGDYGYKTTGESGSKNGRGSTPQKSLDNFNANNSKKK